MAETPVSHGGILPEAWRQAFSPIGRIFPQQDVAEGSYRIMLTVTILW
jgi:hypothetical protein